MTDVDRTPRPCLHPRANHQHGTYLAYCKDRCRCVPCAAAGSKHSKESEYRTATGTHSYVPADRARQHARALLKVLTYAQIEQRSGVHRTAVRVLVGKAPGRPASKRITRATERALLAVRPTRVGPEQHGLVDGTGTRRRLRALVAIGWPLRHLAARIGASSRTTWYLTTPDRAMNDPVKVSTRDAVRELYDELSLTPPPPSGAATKARALAAERKWVPPLAWDDDTIDDPKARPQHRRGARTARRDDVDEVAVQRALTGDRAGELTRAERWIVVAKLAALGMSDAQIADRLGVTERTILRDRQDAGIESRWAAA